MIRVTVLYPKSADSHFDLNYYLTKHIPMTKELLTPTGIVRIEVDEGLAGFPPDQPAMYHAVGYLIFEKVEDLQNGMAAHGAAILGDIPNYTNTQPIVQINRIALG